MQGLAAFALPVPMMLTSVAGSMAFTFDTTHNRALRFQLSWSCFTSSYYDWICQCCRRQGQTYPSYLGYYGWINYAFCNGLWGG